MPQIIWYVVPPHIAKVLYPPLAKQFIIKVMTTSIAAITALGTYAEFSFFVLTHATQVGLTHLDDEKHKIAANSVIQDFTPRIRAAGERVILSTDSGVYLLPPPVEAFREYLMRVESEGFGEAEIRRMITENPAHLFQVGMPKYRLIWIFLSHQVGMVRLEIFRPFHTSGVRHQPPP